MSSAHRIHVPIGSAAGMIARYARKQVREQIRAIAFVVIYLVAFQMIAFRAAPVNALRVAGGIASLVFGLALFLEGIRLGLMPLGERVGIQLPARGGLYAIVIFGVLLGIGSTFAEPAISALRTVAAGTNAWQAPLLYLLLERIPTILILSIAGGVGIAVVLGLLRFYYGLSLKPFVVIILAILLPGTFLFSRSPGLSTVLGLAWDSGAVTTGSVTVPLVLALGIGVSRGAGKSESAAGGFGLVMLASALPVLCVMGLAFAVGRDIPPPSDEAEFFSPHRREQTMRLFASEAELARYAFSAAGEEGRRSFFGDDASYRTALGGLAQDESTREELLGSMSVREWLTTRASDREQALIAAKTPPLLPEERIDTRQTSVLLAESGSAARAILPLAALLGFVLLLLLRDRPRYFDEVILGIALAVLGMTFLSTGIQLGLAPLGDEVGRQLPQALSDEQADARRLVITDFDLARIIEPVDVTGANKEFFYLYDGNEMKLVEFNLANYDPQTGRYIHVERRPSIFHPQLPLIGIAVVMLFAFGLGFGSTLAEPALNALGMTVEDLTVGTVRRRSVIRTVSIGVGIGLVVGVARILYDLPFIWVLLPPYLLLRPLTILGEEEFTSIAWDCGGVTTGPVTVPLVIAMGLGLGGVMGMADGFGILAMASVYPILAMQLYGLLVRMRERRVFRAAGQGESNE